MAEKSEDAAPVLNYRIDADDRLVSVNEAWGEFARRNEGEAVKPERVIGRPLWDFVSGAGIVELYAQMVKRAREGHPVEFSYRCDAPEWRRVFRMEVRGIEDGGVEFCSMLEGEVPRPKAWLLDREQTRDERWARVCSWCQNVALDDKTWVPVEEAVARLELMMGDTVPQLTHGICPACSEAMARKLNSGGIPPVEGPSCGG